MKLKKHGRLSILGPNKRKYLLLKAYISWKDASLYSMHTMHVAECVLILYSAEPVDRRPPHAYLCPWKDHILLHNIKTVTLYRLVRELLLMHAQQ